MLARDHDENKLMRCMDDSDIALNRGSSLNIQTAKAHAVLEISGGRNATSLRRDWEDIAFMRGSFATFSVANAHEVLARF